MLRALAPVGLAVALTLAGCKPSPEPGPGPTTGTGGTSPGTPTGTPGGTPTDSGTTPTTGTTTTTPVDCSNLPAGPVYYTTLTGYSTAEDFDFDGYGYAIAEYSGQLAGKDQSGNTKIIAPNLGGWTAGTRTLATGDIALAVPGDGSLKLFDGTTGGSTLLLGGLSYPNGVEVDELDNVYTADQTTGMVHRVNAYNPADNEVIATGLTAPNGLILSPDGTIMYVGSFGGGMIYAIDKDPVTGTWQTPRILTQSPGGDMGFDGINVDICGNVYWTEYIVGKVRRITPDGLDVELIADLPSGWIPNLRWGPDIGGWRNDILYVSDRDQGRIFALETGIPGKRHVLMP